MKEGSDLCRLCLVEKKGVVNIYKTMTRGTGRSLAETLNELLGMDALSGDDLPEYICFDCLRQVKAFGNISYDQWSTIDYLVRMGEENVVLYQKSPVLSVPEETLAFLRGIHPSTVRGDAFGPGVDGVGAEIGRGLLELEYCWCVHCCKEFYNIKDLLEHSKVHMKQGSHHVGNVDDTDVCAGNLPALSGSCGGSPNGVVRQRCCKVFKTRKRLMGHTEKCSFTHESSAFETSSVLSEDMLQGVTSPLSSHKSTLKRDRNYSVFHRKEEKHAEIFGSVDGDVMFTGYDNIMEGLVTKNVVEKRSGSHLNGSFAELRSPDFNQSEGGFSRVEKNFPQKDSKERGDMQRFPDLNNSKKENGCHSGAGDIDLEIGGNVTEISRGARLSKNKRLVEETRDGCCGRGYICDYCKKACDDKLVLREHISMCHLNFYVYECSVCHKTFSDEAEFKSHLGFHSSDKKYLCTVCSEWFSSHKEVIKHLNGSHNTTKGCVCSVCFSGFPSMFEHGLHHSSHASEKKFMCSGCSKGFLNERYYKNHVRMCQMKLVLHRCKICGKGLVSKYYLKQHMNIHEDVKNYHCHICRKSYISSSYLHRHVRSVHLKIKPYECGICQRSFSLKSDLYGHYAVHSDDRPFGCNDCGKRFKMKHGLNQHKRAVHYGMKAPNA